MKRYLVPFGILILMIGCGEPVSERSPRSRFPRIPTSPPTTPLIASPLTPQAPSLQPSKQAPEPIPEEVEEVVQVDPSDDPSREGEIPKTEIKERPPEERRPPEIRPEVRETRPSSESARFADRIVSFTPGSGAGLNDNRREVVLGPPHGAGCCSGNTDDILSLGLGGTIILEFTDYIIFDGNGVDFTVFENAFEIALANPPLTFAEPAFVAVSEDGINFREFPCNLTQRPYEGCAGVQPVLANPDTNNIDPADPSVSGGDSFDLHDVGLRSVRFVRIRDSGIRFGPIGPGNAGFDLDAVAIIHGTEP